MKKFKLLSLKSLVPQSKVANQRKPVTRLAARLTQPAYDDYEDEPTTKLSTAFVVVLVLHLVAVGGIYAFHSIKTKRREADGTALTASVPSPKEMAVKAEPAAKAPPLAPPHAPASVVPAVASPGTAVAAKGAAVQPLEKVPAGPSAVVPQPAKPAPAAGGAAQAGGAATAKTAKAAVAAPGASGDATVKTYTVQKGDNPVAIAKRMGVNYDELLKVNGVDDPKRLKIGQVLKLPVRTKPSAN
jgi:LysM repeat protein